MKQLMAHMVVPLMFLLGSFFVYAMASHALSPSIEQGPERIEKYALAIEQNPERAASCGMDYILEADKNLLASEQQLLSGLRGFLVEGAIGLFLMSLAWQYYVHTKLRSFGPLRRRYR